MLRCLAPLLLLAACTGGTATDDGDTDTDGAATAAVVGLYETTTDAESTACGTLEDLTLPVPYVLVADLGDGTIETRLCRAVDDCDDFSADGYVYAKDGAKWRALSTWSYTNLTDSQRTCALNARRQVLEERPNGRLRNDGEAVVEVIDGAPAASDAACSAELEDWSPSWTGQRQNCTRWEGKRVED